MSDPGAAQRLVTELKVSGHLMTLDAGLFCVFHTPGGQAPDEATGLPGVRLSPPPLGPSDALSISTFRDDGWLGGRDSAALIRVSHGPAQVLVTVYQMPDGRHDAPRLQVLRLSEGDPVPSFAVRPNAGAAQPADPTLTLAQGQPQRSPQPAPEPARLPAPQAGFQQGPQQGGMQQGGAQPQAAQPAGAPQAGQNTNGGALQGVSPEVAEVAAHVQGRGDVLCRLGEWMGERGSQRWVEGFALAPRGPVQREDIEYQAVLGRGWLSPWAEGGQFCGSRGMGLPILGLRVRVRGEKAQHFACRVVASFVDGSVCGPVEDGEACEAESLAPLEAFVVEVVPAAAGSRAAPRQREGVRREMAYEAVPERPTRTRAAIPAAKAPVRSRSAATPVRAAAKPAPRTSRPAAKAPTRAAAKPSRTPARPAPSRAAPAKPKPGRGKPPPRGRR